MGILVGAVIVTFLHLTSLVDITLEYLLGFGFGWTIFQALFMRGTSGGSYSRALSKTFIPELLSMNGVMAGMVPVMTLAMVNTPGSHDPLSMTFWFIMSMALLAGFVVTFPINWWLVVNKLKHRMMTVRPAEKTGLAEAVQEGHGAGHPPMEPVGQMNPSNAHLEHSSTLLTASRGAITLMTILTFVLFGVGLTVSAVFGGL